MKRTICKITAFLLLLSLTLATFSGCARESEDEFLTLVGEMLEKSAVVNEICFAEGLSYGDADGYVTSGYEEATKASREKYGVESVEDIKAKIKEIYSVTTVEYIDTVIFKPVKVDTSFASYRRYFDAMDGEGGIALMVKKDYEPLAYGDVTYDNLRIAKHGRSRAEILVDITVTDGKESRTDRDVTLPLRFEDGAWKFEIVTYSSLK